MEREPLLWVDNDGKLAYSGVEQRYWTTTDAGLTWQKSPKPKELGPAGSSETFTADDKLTDLATLPPHGLGDKESARNPVVAAADGSYWVACITGSCVQVTHDRGSTWQVLSTVDSATRVEWVATSDGRTVYAAVRTGTGSRLLRSVDAGATWVDVLAGWAGAGFLDQPSAAGVALPNGDVILSQASDEGGVYRVSPAAKTVERLTDAPAHAKVLYLTGGVVVAAPAWSQLDDSDPGSLVSVSADGGTTWSSVPTPSA